MLSRFEPDLQHLAATELHPALRGSEEGAASLAGLVSAEALRESAAACARGHQHFGGKVAELEGLFGMLKADVEALFMQVGAGGACVGGCCCWGCMCAAPLCRPRAQQPALRSLAACKACTACTRSLCLLAHAPARHATAPLTPPPPPPPPGAGPQRGPGGSDAAAGGAARRGG